MSFLFQRQMTQFLQFIVLALGIAVLLYFPGIIETPEVVLQHLLRTTVAHPCAGHGGLNHGTSRT